MKKYLANPRVATFLILTVILVIALAGKLQKQSSRSILTRAEPPSDHRIQYGKGPLQFGELRLPKGSGPYPIAVVIHGGCWMSEYGLSYMGHLSADLAAAGVATWNLEYRRVGDEGGGWPGTFQDIAQGTDYLRTLAKSYPLDLERAIALGHSSGGHLVLWLAGRRNLPKDSPLYAPNSLPLKGVVALAPIPDLSETGSACDQSVLGLMGGRPEDQRSRYLQASPIELLPLGVKQTLISGDSDNLVPPHMSKDYAAAAKSKGDDVDLVLIEKAGHFEPVDPESFAWPRVKEEVLKLLTQSMEHR